MRLELAGLPRVRDARGETYALAARDAALLAWLALEGPTPRARLAALLWPGSAPEAAANALRQRVFQMRKAFGDGLVGGQGTLALARGVTHDLEAAHDVLAGVELAASAEFGDWLAQQRARAAQRGLAALAAKADDAEAGRDWLQALALAAQLLALEPLSELAHRRLMRLHYLAGDRAAALLAFDRCERVLKDEVGTSPSAETLALLATIQGAVASPPSTAGALPAALARPPRMVGRDDEVEQVRSAWQSRHRALVLGEPGMGKSRLLEALASVAEDDGAAAAWLVRARPGDEAVPLAGVIRLVTAMSQGAASPGLQTLRERVEAVVAADARRPDGASGASGAPPVSPGRPLPRPVARPLLPALVQALAAPAAAGARLLFDDWQFADAASADLLGEALDAPELAGLHVAIASRTGAGAVADARIEQLRLRSDVRTVALPPLDAAAASALVDSLGLGQAAEPGFAAAVRQRVGGNPLFLLEALRELLRRERAFRADALDVPRHVRVLLAERLARLPDAARQLLRVAAVAGSDFDIALAEAVTGLNVLVLAEPWALLEQQGLLGAHGIGHDLYAEAVLEHLPRPVAALIHARVAAWLEPRAAEPARLAAHWRAAGEDARAVPHLEAAARRAWLAARPDDVVDLYAQAAAIEAGRGQEGRAFDLWFDCADAITECGSADQARRCLEAMAPLAGTEARRLRLRLVQAVTQILTGESERGLREVAALLSDAIALGDARVEAECRFAIANRAAADGRFDDAVQHLVAGERLMRDVGDERRAATLAASMTLVHGLRGRPQLALAEYERMLPLLATHSDRSTLAVMRASKALQHARRGDLATALTEASQARREAAAASIAAPDLLVILRSLVDTYTASGEFAVALDVAEELRERLLRQGSALHVTTSLPALYLNLGRADLAQPGLDALRASPPARARERSQLALLEFKRALLLEAPIAGRPDGVASAGEDLPLAAEWALWLGLLPAAGDAGRRAQLAELETLVERCRSAGLALLLPALERLLQARRPQGATGPDTTCPLPRSDRSDLAVNDGSATGAMVPWCALFGAQAALRNGHAGLAAQRVRQGLHWLHHTAVPRLPEPFRHSFAQRHPLHRALRQLQPLALER